VGHPPGPTPSRCRPACHGKPEQTRAQSSSPAPCATQRAATQQRNPAARLPAKPSAQHSAVLPLLPSALHPERPLPEQLSVFHLGSSGLNEYQDRLDQVGRSVRAAADLAQDAPGVELGVAPFAGTALSGVGGVDLALVA
jgi:hypothetical protein